MTALPDSVKNVQNPGDNQNNTAKVAQVRNYHVRKQRPKYKYEQEPKNRRLNATTEKLPQPGNNKRRDSANQFVNLFSHNENPFVKNKQTIKSFEQYTTKEIFLQSYFFLESTEISSFELCI